MMLELQQAKHLNCVNAVNPAEKQHCNLLLVSTDPECGGDSWHAQYLFRNSPVCSLAF